MVYHPTVRTKGLAVLVGLFGVAVWFAWGRLSHVPFPPDTTPEGAYLRVAYAVAQDRPRDFFAYVETDAQWAAFTLHDARQKAQSLVSTQYPEDERSELLASWGPATSDGADAFEQVARRRGWLTRLKRDLSGVRSVQIEAERATVVTARGTRYPFRRRENGLWGLTVFTAELLAEAQRASRDLDVVEKAARDYARSRL
ncbi:MAG: hypothetical protein WCI05_04140 [Myxococcales bacterium]